MIETIAKTTIVTTGSERDVQAPQGSCDDGSEGGPGQPERRADQCLNNALVADHPPRLPA